mgnify:CR=1 FL=1
MERGAAAVATALALAAWPAAWGCSAFEAEASVDAGAPPADGGAGADGPDGTEGSSSDPCASHIPSGPVADPAAASCGGRTVNLTNDPFHCGECDRRCPSGSSCVDAQCQGELWTSVDGGGIAALSGASGQEIFFFDETQGLLFAASTETRQRRGPLTNDGGSYSSARVEGDLAILVGEDRVSTLPIAGGAAEVRVPGSGLSRARVAVSSARLLVGRDDDIRVAPRSKGASTLFVGGLNDVRSVAVTVDDSEVYWVSGADGSEPGLYRRTGQIQERLLDVPGAYELEVDDAFVYFVDANARAIRRVRRGRGAADLEGPVDVASLPHGDIQGLDFLRLFTVAPPYVYFVRATSAGGSFAYLYRVHRCGGAPLLLAGSFVPTGIAVSGDYVYVSSGESVYRTLR